MKSNEGKTEISASKPTLVLSFLNPSRRAFWLPGLMVVVLVLVSCSEPDTPATSSTNTRITGPLTLSRIIPLDARARQGFNVQPNGESALSAIGENALPDTVIIFDSKPLISVYGGPSLVTAFVPGELTEDPGRYEVYLQNGANESNRLVFEVKP